MIRLSVEPKCTEELWPKRYEQHSTFHFQSALFKVLRKSTLRSGFSAISVDIRHIKSYWWASRGKGLGRWVALSPSHYMIGHQNLNMSLSPKLTELQRIKEYAADILELINRSIKRLVV
jgi:hypothetical protein